jgi:TolA-binding protein
MQTRKRLTNRRITRRELKRDPFVDTVFDWTVWVRENLRTVLVGVGVLAAVVAGLLLFRASRTAEDREASRRFREIMQAYEVGNYQLAANDLRQFRQAYESTELADDAALYLGDSYVRAGDHPAAINVLRDFEDRYGESPYRHAAAALLGAAYESSGDWTKAAEAYERARELGEHDYQKVDALLDLARVRIAAGDEEAGLEAYRTVVSDFPEAARASEARVRVAELTVEPLAGARAEAAGSPEAPPGTAAGGEPDASAPERESGTAAAEESGTDAANVQQAAGAAAERP